MVFPNACVCDLSIPTCWIGKQKTEKNYNNKIITVKRHAKNLFKSFSTSICKYAKNIFFCTWLLLFFGLCLWFVFVLFSVHFHQYGFRLTRYEFIEIAIIHSIGLEFCWEKSLDLFPSLSLCLSHTHKKILFGYLHIWTLFIQSIYMYVFVSGDVTNINAKRNKYGFLIRGVYMMVATILFLENNFQLRF